MKDAEKYLQALMEDVLEEVNGVMVKIYLGHILVHTEDGFRLHFQIVKKIFKELKKANLKIDATASAFLMEELTYLGYDLSSDGFLPADDKLEKIRDFGVPENQSDVRSFTGLICQYKEFVSNFDELAKPLTRLTSPNVEFRWTDVEWDAFDVLKQCFANLHPKRFAMKGIAY